MPSPTSQPDRRLEILVNSVCAIQDLKEALKVILSTDVFVRFVWCMVILRALRIFFYVYCGYSEFEVRQQGHSVSKAASYCQVALLTASRPNEREHHGNCILKCQHCSASAEMPSSNTENTEHSNNNH